MFYLTCSCLFQCPDSTTFSLIFNLYRNLSEKRKKKKNTKRTFISLCYKIKTISNDFVCNFHVEYETYGEPTHIHTHMPWKMIRRRIQILHEGQMERHKNVYLFTSINPSVCHFHISRQNSILYIFVLISKYPRLSEIFIFICFSYYNQINTPAVVDDHPEFNVYKSCTTL